MITLNQFESAFRSPDPGGALLDLIRTAAAGGESRAAIYDQFESTLLRLREAGPRRDDDLTVLLDAMDALCGYGQPLNDFPFHGYWDPEGDRSNPVAG